MCTTDNRRCISNDYLCDCFGDCADWDDEVDCENMSKCATVVANNSMGSTQVQRMFNADSCLNINKFDEYGWISTPNFPNAYPFDTNCSYHIRVELYQTIQIRFKTIQLRVSTQRPTVRLLRTLSKQRAGGTLKSLPVNDDNNPNYDFISIYDGNTISDPLIVKVTAVNNDMQLLNRVYNSKSNSIYVVFSSIGSAADRLGDLLSYKGFNLTYQVKGLCIDDQVSCHTTRSQHVIQDERNCYDESQKCDGTWDCHSGADERGCSCSLDQFLCKNRNYCYRYEERCDGEHQCMDKSDELNCDAWFCNSANGTFLCANNRCIYEQWVCDGTNDCEDGSDELNCPIPFTRRVITTAVLGGTLCCLLLVMALGCACKLYTLRSIEYRASRHFASSDLPPIAHITQTRSQRDLSSDTTSTRRTQRRRPFSLFNFFTRNNRRSTEQTTTGNALIRSTSLTSLDCGHSIAPPTYNQTMGLVDEYEQRQLAFIEHIRSIINSTNGQGPPVSSSSTNNNANNHTHHANGRRRSSRHAGTSRSTRTHESIEPVINPLNHHQTGVSTSEHRNRTRRHRHRQGHNHEPSARRIVASLNIVANSHQSNQELSHMRTSSSHNNQLGMLHMSDSTVQHETNNTELGGATTASSSNDLSKMTSNLKNRITKLINDIVNHGDNVHYVSLADSNNSQQHSPTMSNTINQNPSNLQSFASNDENAEH
jgi:hypothetical protein